MRSESSLIWFTFDDGNTSDLWAANILSSFSLKAIFFLNDTIDLPYQVEALLKFGMIIGNHTNAHQNLSRLTDDAVYSAVIPFNEKLMRLGATGEYFAYPYSEGRSKVIDENFQCIYRGCERPRVFDGEIARVTVEGKSFAEVLSYQIPLQMHGIDTGRSWDVGFGVGKETRERFIALCRDRVQR